MGELARAEQVTPPTMTRLVASLETDGFVERRPDDRDGRVVRVHPTTSARRVLEAGRARRVEHLAELLAGLNEADLDVVLEATELMEDLLRSD